MVIKCDVLIIGGGPAGSSAARAAALNGANTVLIEKKSKITQVACAEGVGSYLFPLLPFKIPKNQLIWKINGMSFSDGSTELLQKGNFYKGWSLERKNFDYWLLEKAKTTGVNVMLNTQLIDLKFSKEYHVNEAIIQKDNKTLSIIPSFIVAADGAESTVTKGLGVKEKNSNKLAYVYSWEMKNLSIKNPHMEQIYFGDFAPRAYAYLFPKSATTANIGIGSTKGDKNLQNHFNKFVDEIICSQTRNAIKTVDRSGTAPIKNATPKLRYGNVIFAGDAANQNLKPYFEGILPSIICGDIAGKVACSKGKINYENYIKRKLGNQFKKSDKIFEKFYQIDQFEEKKNLLNMYLFAFTDTKKIEGLVHKDNNKIIEELFRKSSGINRFITMLRYFIWYSKILTTRSD